MYSLIRACVTWRQRIPTGLFPALPNQSPLHNNIELGNRNTLSTMFSVDRSIILFDIKGAYASR